MQPRVRGVMRPVSLVGDVGRGDGGRQGFLRALFPVQHVTSIRFPNPLGMESATESPHPHHALEEEDSVTLGCIGTSISSTD